jgi:hypothetical protein
VQTPKGCSEAARGGESAPDEYFQAPDDVHFKVSPDAPEYLRQFRAGNTLKHMGVNNQDPAHALGFSFSGQPLGQRRPGSPGRPESITFLDALVGVSGKCNVLVSSNCTFAIIPGTTFQWTAAAGVVSATFSAGGRSPGSTACCHRARTDTEPSSWTTLP